LALGDAVTWRGAAYSAHVYDSIGGQYDRGRHEDPRIAARM